MVRLSGHREPVGALNEQIEDWGAPDWVPYVMSGLIGVVAILLWTVLSVLAFIWIERRVVGLMQNRIGPNRVGPMGLLQPVADALKLLFKEPITTRDSDRVLFWLAPIVVFIPTLVVFAVIPFGEQMVLADLNVGVLFLIAIGSINTIAVFMAGWSSNNKYALLGGDADDRDADQLRADPGVGAAGGGAVRWEHAAGGYRGVAGRTTVCG